MGWTGCATAARHFPVLSDRHRRPRTGNAVACGSRTDEIYAEGSDSCLRVIYTKIRFLYITRPSSPAAAPPPAPNPADNFYVRYAVG